MSDSKPVVPEKPQGIEENEPKWDYTNREQTMFIGALVVFLNLLVVLGVILDRTVPAVHSFITGKPF